MSAFMSYRPGPLDPPEDVFWAAGLHEYMHGHVRLAGISGMGVSLHGCARGCGRCVGVCVAFGAGYGVLRSWALVRVAAEARALGAVDFLEKPFDEILFVSRLRAAFASMTRVAAA